MIMMHRSCFVTHVWVSDVMLTDHRLLLPSFLCRLLARCAASVIIRHTSHPLYIEAFATLPTSSQSDATSTKTIEAAIEKYVAQVRNATVSWQKCHVM